MNEYVSKEAMLKNLTAELEQHLNEGDPRTHLVIQRFIKYVEDFPTVDVPPAKLGTWENERYYSVLGRFYATCSECGCESADVNSITNNHKYCEHCGARMGGDTNGA